MHEPYVGLKAALDPQTLVFARAIEPYLGMPPSIPRAGCSNGGLYGNHGCMKGIDEKSRRLGRKWVTTLVEVGGLTANHRVLDVGCGPGRMATAIGERFDFANAYLGFDVRRKDVDLCRAEISAAHANFTFEHINVYNGQYNPKGTVKPGDVRFPADDGAYDFAFATSVFTHMFTVEMAHYVGEARRTLRAGGTFLATFFALGEIAPTRLRFDFATRQDDHCFIAFTDRPEKAVAYPVGFIRDVFAGAGFADVRHHPGGWTGRDGARHNQDTIVATAA